MDSLLFLSLVWLFGFHRGKARNSDRSDHLNEDFFGGAFGVQKFLGLIGSEAA
jgi:hypothetical protein